MKPSHLFLLMVILLSALSGCRKPEKIVLKKIASGLINPTFLTSPPNDNRRLFVLEQIGRVRIIKDGQLLKKPFLDLTEDVWWNGGEMGLLGMAFHPKFETNRFFYVHYTDRQRRTRIIRYMVSNNPDTADVGSAKQILRMRRPTHNHNGGMISFGPDGMFYIGMGDGGWIGDPRGYAQSKTSILGHILRIDVDHGDPYSIPSDNPYAGQEEVRAEIWASGLRNPWRFSIDPNTDLLYIADTGERLSEEVNVMPRTQPAVNYGWNIMEGTHCFTTDRKHVFKKRYVPDPTCNREGLTLPVIEYSHSEGCAIIGGFVYRGADLRSIQGHYFYADYCLGWIRSFVYRRGKATETRQWDFGVAGNVLSFGEDSARNLYVLYEQGDVYRFAKK